MNNSISRREFLKLAGLISASLSLPKSYIPQQFSGTNVGNQNFLVIIYDAFSARHSSLYGYPRQTTPRLVEISQKAIVYHNHYSGSNFTSPGVGSIFTGTLPWTHRAFKHNDRVAPEFEDKNLFHLFSNYNRMAYTHNPLVDTQIRQFRKDIEEYTPLADLYLANFQILAMLSGNDPDAFKMIWSRIMKEREGGYPYSLFLSNLYSAYLNKKIAPLRENFPRGLPYSFKDDYFALDDAIHWLQGHLTQAQQPFFGYFHFLPPHSPYCTNQEYYHTFYKDGYRPTKKPKHLFTMGLSDHQLRDLREEYDEYILYVDDTIEQIYRSLEKSGLTENTWIVLTSDHGELFERGVSEHNTPLLYQSVIHVPLVIFEPGRKTRQDIHEYTSATDILPTMMHVSGQSIPDWTEGLVLPPFSSEIAVNQRDLFALTARHTRQQSPITESTISLIKGQYKLIYYFGYKELRDSKEQVEMYHLQDDPEELHNLYPQKKSLAEDMVAMIKTKLAEVNKPYL